MFLKDIIYVEVFMKKKLRILLSVLLVSTFIISGCSMMPRLNASAQTVIDSKKELLAEIEDALSSGKTKISFVTSELTQEDFDTLNQNIEGFYGSVKEYQIKSVKFLNKSYVTLSCEISDNYYVERAFSDKEDIPEDRDKARDLYKVCQSFLNGLQSKKQSDYEKEKLIHDYIVSSVVYGYPSGKKEPEGDAYSAYGALVLKKAVCNGYAEAMKLLCDLSGVTCKMISGTADGENHAWNLIKLDKDWYHVDPTWDDPEPDDTSRIMYTYFNVNDTQMKTDHNWNATLYQKAEGEKYNYYRKKDLLCENYKEFRRRCEDLLEKESPESLQLQVKDYNQKTYSNDNLQFILRYSGASSLRMQIAGKAPYTTLYFKLQY